MILSTKLLNLLGILAIGSFSLEVAVAGDDLDDTLKQALFLVKLLKSDFAQILRTNDDVTANFTEEENSTCSLPSEEFNSTVAMNETEVTASPVTPSTPASGLPSTPASGVPSTPDAPPAPPNTMPPGAPMMMPYAGWPSMPMGYPPPPGPGRQNFPDENYRFPYRLNRRRMMPDYYYFDSPAKSRGNFRRFGNDPADDPPATSHAQTTSSPSATSEATTLHVEETTASTNSLPTTLAQTSTSILPTTVQPILRTTISANHTILTTADSAKESIPADPSNQTISPTTAKSIVSTATSTKQSILPTTEEPHLPTTKLSKQPKHRKRVRHRTRVPVSKATTSVMSTRHENHHVSRYHLRHQAHHTTTTENSTKEDVEMAQVASELEKELESTNTEDALASYKDYEHQNLKKRIKKKKRTTTPRTTTTMKVFLQGSSRIPIPFPENNGFCHFHPENALCGAI